MGRDMMRLRRGILLNTPHEEQASGAVASFATDIGKLKECVVGIEPVQDLHGYDSPWPPGGGANLMLANKTNRQLSNYGVTVTWNADTETAVINGTNTEASYHIVWTSLTCQVPTFAAGEQWFFVTDAPTGVYLSLVYGKTGGGVGNMNHVNGNGNLQAVPFTVANDYASFTRFQIGIHPSAAISNKTAHFGVFKAAQTAWTPYSNICPISGWSEAKVTGTGKNLLNTAIKRLYSSTICEIGSSYTAFDLHLKAGTYTMSVSFSGTRSYGAYCREKNGSGNIAFWYSNANVGGIRNGTLTLPEGDYRFWLYYSGGISLDVIEWFQLELGSTASAYEPYQVNTYTIDLDGTRYGGTLDVLTGVLTVDRANVDLGSLNWGVSGSSRFYNVTRLSNFKFATSVAERAKGLLCSSYPFSTNLSFSDKMDNNSMLRAQSTQRYDVVIRATEYGSDTATFKTAMAGVQLVYELASPFTVQLTPTQLRALKGQNNIFADCGNVAVDFWKHGG